MFRDVPLPDQVFHRLLGWLPGRPVRNLLVARSGILASVWVTCEASGMRWKRWLKAFGLGVAAYLVAGVALDLTILAAPWSGVAGFAVGVVTFVLELRGEPRGAG